MPESNRKVQKHQRRTAGAPWEVRDVTVLSVADEIQRTPRSQRGTLARFALWTLLLASALVLGTAVGSAVRGDPPTPAANIPPAVVSAPEGELPREWRWERAPVTFDHMFRKSRETLY